MKLDGFGIFVKDMPTMVRFYRDVADPEGNLIEIGSFNQE